jgi:hypothetical protein
LQKCSRDGVYWAVVKTTLRETVYCVLEGGKGDRLPTTPGVPRPTGVPTTPGVPTTTGVPTTPGVPTLTGVSEKLPVRKFATGTMFPGYAGTPAESLT